MKKCKIPYKNLDKALFFSRNQDLNEIKKTAHTLL